jgi:hypothetical protein
MLSAEVPKLPALMDEAEADVFAFMSFPKDHRDAAFARADRGDDPVAGKRQQIVDEGFRRAIKGGAGSSRRSILPRWRNKSVATKKNEIGIRPARSLISNRWPS